MFLGWGCVLSGVVLELDTVLPSMCGVFLSEWVFWVIHMPVHAYVCTSTAALCLPSMPGSLLPAFALNRSQKGDLDLDVCCVLGGELGREC